MTTQRVADLTMDELRMMIAQIVKEETRHRLISQHPINPQRVREILDRMDRIRWTPPPGAPSVVEMLREDRDR